MMKKEMSALPEPVKSFNEELAEMLTQKPPVSSSKMKDITRCAMKAQKYYKHIVMSVEKLIQKCKPEFKLSSIYVIDAIVRQSRHQNKDRDVYAGRFESNLHLTASHLFKSSKSDQVKICRTFKLWELSKVFSYHSIQKCLNNANPDTRKEGVQLAEDSFAKMAVEKPPVNPDIKKQQKELEDQRRKITEQQEELKRKQEALFQQNSAAIPPILGNLLHFGQQINDQTDEPAAKAAETAKKVKSLLDDFDYSDEDEIKQPGKKVTPKMKSPPPTSTPKKSENVATPSPVTAAHNTSIYEPDPPDDAQEPPVFAPPKTEKYDTKNLEKLYTPSPVDKTSKKSKHKSPERSREKDKKSHKSERSNSSKRDSDRSRDRDRSPDRSRDRSKEKSSSRRRSSAEKRSSKTSSSRSGKRSRSASPDHYSKKRERISKADCATVLSFTIWIGNLRKTVTKEDIGSLMKKYTESCSIDMVPPRGCAYINVGNRQTAETVLKEFKDLKLHGATCKVAWAPGKGCKELKDHWNIEKGATFIPYKTFEKLKISSLEDGGEILETTLPDGFKIEDKRKEEKRPKMKNPLLSLNLPSNISVFSSQLTATDTAQSDEEMTDAFSPIPILPVPTIPDYGPPVLPPAVPMPGFMPSMNPLLPPPTQSWLPPPRPTPPNMQSAPAMQHPFGYNYSIPPPTQMPLPSVPPVSVPNLSQIPLPAAPNAPLPGPAVLSPLPRPRMNTVASVSASPAHPKPLMTPQTPVFRFKRSPSPPSPRTIAKNMDESDNSDDDTFGYDNDFNKSSNKSRLSPAIKPKIHAGSLPSFNRSISNGASASQAITPKVHAGSLPPFNDNVSVNINKSPPTPVTPTTDGKPGFVSSMKPALNPAQPGFVNSMQPASPSRTKPGFVISMRATSPVRDKQPSFSMINQANRIPLDEGRKSPERRNEPNTFSSLISEVRKASDDKKANPQKDTEQKDAQSFSPSFGDVSPKPDMPEYSDPNRFSPFMENRDDRPLGVKYSSQQFDHNSKLFSPQGPGSQFNDGPRPIRPQPPTADSSHPGRRDSQSFPDPDDSADYDRDDEQYSRRPPMAMRHMHQSPGRPRFGPNQDNVPRFGSPGPQSSPGPRSNFRSNQPLMYRDSPRNMRPPPPNRFGGPRGFPQGMSPRGPGHGNPARQNFGRGFRQSGNNRPPFNH